MARLVHLHGVSAEAQEQLSDPRLRKVKCWMCISPGECFLGLIEDSEKPTRGTEKRVLRLPGLGQ